MARRRLLDFTTVTGSHVFYGLQRFDGSHSGHGFQEGTGSQAALGFHDRHWLAR